MRERGLIANPERRGKRLLINFRALAALAALLLCADSAWATACTTGTVGAYTCKQACVNQAFSASTTTCTFASNITSGSEVYLYGWQASTTGTIAFSASSGCSGMTFSSTDGTVTGIGAAAAQAVASVPSTEACTIRMTAGASSSLIGVIGVELAGTNNTVDKHSLLNKGSVSSGSSISGTSITTTVSGDLILQGVVGYSTTGDTYTAGSGSILYQGDSMAIQGQSQASAGAVNPTITSNKNDYFLAGNLAIEPSGGAAACSPTLALMGVGRCG